MPLHGLRILITEHHGSQSAVLAGLGPISETDAGGNRSVVRSREEGRARVINALVIVALVIIALEIIDQVVKELAGGYPDLRVLPGAGHLLEENGAGEVLRSAIPAWIAETFAQARRR